MRYIDINHHRIRNELQESHSMAQMQFLTKYSWSLVACLRVILPDDCAIQIVYVFFYCTCLCLFIDQHIYKHYQLLCRRIVCCLLRHTSMRHSSFGECLRCFKSSKPSATCCFMIKYAIKMPDTLVCRVASRYI